MAVTVVVRRHHITAVQNCWLPPSFVSLSSGPWSEVHGTFSNKNLCSTSWEQPRVIAIGVCFGTLLEESWPTTQKSFSCLVLVLLDKSLAPDEKIAHKLYIYMYLYNYVYYTFFR